jgi:antitoxin (DNA-binding transcriptional repressor) of toxin-antitoxin stability system
VYTGATGGYAGRMADEDTVSVRELRAGLAHYLELAHGGQRIVITRAARVDAQLGPAEKGASDGEDG